MEKIKSVKRYILNISLVGVLLGYTMLSSVSMVKADFDGNTCEVGIAVVGDYSDWDDLDDLSSPIQIRDDIVTAFDSGSAKSWEIGFERTDSEVTKNIFKAVSLGGKDNEYTDDVDLLFYSGHGLLPDKHGSDDYAFALDYGNTKHYAKQNEMYLGNRDLEWLVTFTCNFCNGGLENVGRLAKGLHAVCGYSTRVLLVPTMGETMSAKLKKGISVKEAFFATAHETQPWSDGVKHPGRTAAVFTTKTCANDCIWGYGNVASDPTSYSKDASTYIMYSYKY